MTRKAWFQIGIGILLFLLIVKFVVEVSWIFKPIQIVLKTIFLPALIAGVIFYITVPFQLFLEKYKVPRWGSITIIFLVLIAFIWAAIAIIGPPITEQVNNLIINAPMIASEVNQLFIQVIQQTGNLPDWAKDSIDSATESLNEYTVQFGKWIVQFLQSVFQGTIVLVLVPFFLVFMLKDHEKFVPFILQFFSGEVKKWLAKTLKDIDDVLSLYIRGQILISCILGLLLYIGYLIIGLNFALLLSVFALFMNIIPFIGPWIAFIPALIIGLFQDPMMVVWVSITTLIAQQIDSNLITPNVMGRTLNIHPLTIITILLAAGSLAGFFGILLAVPGYAVGKAIVSNVYERRHDILKALTRTT